VTADLLLIHGAWQGAWVWDALVPELGARGWRCHAVELPENGQPGAPAGPASLDAYVAHCAAVMPERAIVIAHSGAGVIASQLAEAHPERVACIVYLTGMMLPSGLGFAELVRQVIAAAPEAAGVGPYLEWSDDRVFSRVPPQAAIDIFLQDCPPAVAAVAATRLTPQRETARALVATLTPERFGRVPRIYLEAVHDRSVVLAAQRRMQALVPGALRLSMDTGHAPHVAQPAALAMLLDEALARFRVDQSMIVSR
jgi:pimeloyl-ACP methyl ester carboxylesterase